MTVEADAAGSPFQAYAVESRSGPHVTMQAGLLHAGRYWTTTSRSSFKARSIDDHGVACAVITDDGESHIVAGRTRSLSLSRPFGLLPDLLAPLWAPSAVARLGLAQLDQVLGYLEAARIPPDWLPHRRVLLVTHVDRSLMLDGDALVGATGSWSRTAPRTLRLARRRTKHASVLPHQQLPRVHRSVVRLGGRAHLGVSTADGPVALPARWIGEDRLVVSAPALAAVGASFPGPAVSVFDESTSRRPDEKLGVMFRGHAALLAVDGGQATVALQTDRITTWDGFHAATTAVAS